MSRLPLQKPIRGTICFRIFNDGFPCWTKRLWTIRDDEAALWGVRSTGQRTVDDAMLSQIVRVTIPISDMVAIRQAGGDVEIEKPEHRLLVAELIDAHMTNWAKVALAMYEPEKNMPLDDLRDMHEFQVQLMGQVEKDRLKEDRDAFDKANVLGETLGEYHSYLRIERTGRPIRSSLGRSVPLELDLPDDVGEFGNAMGRARHDDAEDTEDVAFNAFRRPSPERSTAFEAIQALIKGRKA